MEKFESLKIIKTEKSSMTEEGFSKLSLVKKSISEQVKDLLRDLFFEDWMNETDWEEFLKDIETQTAFTNDTLVKEIEEGIRNGYSVKEQFAMIKKMLQK